MNRTTDEAAFDSWAHRPGAGLGGSALETKRKLARHNLTLRGIDVEGLSDQDVARITVDRLLEGRS